MQVGDIVQRIATVVHLQIHPEGLGQVRDLDEGRDAALDRDVAAQEIGRPLGDPRDVGIEPADRVFGGEDWDIELLLQLDVVVNVLVGERVLVPVETHLLDRSADPQRLLIAIAPG